MPQETPRSARLVLGAAGVYSALLPLAAMTVPMYSGSSSTTYADGTVTTESTHATLVDLNGTWALVVSAIPLTAVLVVAVLLLVSGRRRWTFVAAGVVIAALGVLSLAGMMTIGPLIAPVPLMLAAAMALLLDSRHRPATWPRPDYSTPPLPFP